MNAPRRRRKKEKVRVRKETHERWLLTYSDLITLLLAFFIIMYSVASLNQGKFRQLAQSLHLAFSGSTTPIQFASASRLGKRSVAKGEGA
ncbi:MAG: flagellar motor protein MotB [Bacilli bacterium]